ncbi:MAG: NYN domain-containing protein [Chloroflexi bacterium]|nr:NYN domain-containing protein [Chloroflexota bacterium]
MADNNENFVALFIDWDNLAISIAADLGGATPDVKRIVQTAQKYGTILIARAYAEWNATSDRLNLYRAGVEPVYAPTFRFDADPITQAARGKSLADPCMVADCVDILHLLPKITTFVVVSGDKDLIPVVRLAQLRGKRVAVIGPDYAAGVLREIADEFISYRTLVEAGNGRMAESSMAETAKGNHRRPPVRAVPSQQPSRMTRDIRPAAVPQPPVKARPRDILPDQPEPTPQTVVSEISELPAIEAAAPKEVAYDLPTVFAALVDIVKQRTGEGKHRLRATNLKDSLMIRLPGFSERKYGFAKFKDFLLSAEKAGFISVSVAGPVHWVSLPEKIDETSEALAPAVVEQPVAAEAPDIISIADDHYAGIVKFLIDLRGRSRWLTYTYVLTNLISFLNRLLPQADAESAARATLNRLVQEGILRIDREPQEVEVGGIKHRVRMCHIEEKHPLVAEMLTAIRSETQQVEAELATMQTTELAEESPEPEPAALIASEGEDGLAGVEPLADEANVGPEDVSECPPEAVEQVGAQPTATGDVEPAATSEEDETSQAPAPQEPPVASSKGDRQPETEQVRNGDAQTTAAAEAKVDHGSALIGIGVPLRLDEAFAAVDRVIRKSTAAGRAGKMGVRLTGLKAKLTGELGHFDEQIYGFSKFKDFLVAAERAGWIKLEASGPAVWVKLPAAPEDEPPTDSAPPPIVEPETELKQADVKSAGKRPRGPRRRSQAKAKEVLVET